MGPPPGEKTPDATREPSASWIEAVSFVSFVVFCDAAYGGAK
jgi:hypothetical protein